MQRRSLLSSFLGGMKERKGAWVCVLILWLKRRRSGGHGLHQSPQETTSTAAGEDPSGVLWELQIQYCGWQTLREVTENLLITGDTSETQSRSCRGAQGSGGSCDALFFKLCKALKGRHKEVCSSLRGGQIMLEDKDESGFRWEAQWYICSECSIGKHAGASRRSGDQDTHISCFPPAKSAINKAETVTTINIPSREKRTSAAGPGLGSSDGPGWQNKKRDRNTRTLLLLDLIL